MVRSGKCAVVPKGSVFFIPVGYQSVEEPVFKDGVPVEFIEFSVPEKGEFYVVAASTTRNSNAVPSPSANKSVNNQQNNSLSFGARYALGIKEQIRSSGVCGNYRQMLDQYIYSDMPDRAIQRVADNILDKAAKYNCL